MNEIDPRLVRLVARHFNGLKGLQTAMLGFILSIADWAWLSSGSMVITALAAVYAVLIAIVPVALYGSDYYARLGRVVTDAPASRAGAFLIRWMTLPTVTLLLRLQDHNLRGFPSLLWLVVSVYPAWLALDGWPYRWYHLVTSAAAIYVAFGRPIDAASTDFAWAASRLWVFGVAVIATGIADHFLLVRVMRPTDYAAEEIAS